MMNQQKDTSINYDEARLLFYKPNSTTMSIIAYLSRISTHKLYFLALVRPGQSFIDSVSPCSINLFIKASCSALVQFSFLFFVAGAVAILDDVYTQCCRRLFVYIFDRCARLAGARKTNLHLKSYARN